MTKALEELDVCQLGSTDLAIFLDFDGTLVEIADHPENVELLPETRRVLARLSRVLDGALAVISGRAIDDVDRFLAPLRLPVAGVHGLERRDCAGTIHAREIDTDAIDELRETLQGFVAETTGLFLESKPGSIALHFRARPELAQRCIDMMHQCAGESRALHILRGKKVIEAKASRVTKAEALSEFMREPPFLGRRPLCAGDDITDEAAFRATLDLGGVSVKVGCGETCALYRSAEPGEFLDWLGRLAGVLEQGIEVQLPGTYLI